MVFLKRFKPVGEDHPKDFRQVIATVAIVLEVYAAGDIRDSRRTRAWASVSWKGSIS